MIRLFFSVFIVFLCSGQSYAYTSGQNVRVRIYKNLDSIQISGLGLRVGREGDMRLLLEKKKRISASKHSIIIEAESLKINNQPAPSKSLF